MKHRATALVLGGGNALGAFDAGAFEAVTEYGTTPDWVAGASVGAITAAIIAGNPAPQRIPRLREFWRRATMPSGIWDFELPGWSKALHLARAAQVRFFGRPALFAPRLTGLLPMLARGAEEVSLYDYAPLRQTLRELIDFSRLNDGAMRLSVMTVDLETGDEVVFDTRRVRVEVDHLLASAGLIPDFPPSEIGGQLLGDGGLSANAPLEIVLADAPADLLCLVADCFPRKAPRPSNWHEASERQTDLLFANQTKKALDTAAKADALRRELREALDALPAALRSRKELRPLARLAERGSTDVVRVEYWPAAEELGMKWFDFSAASIERRWQAGRAAIHAALDSVSLLPGRSGLRVVGQ